MSATLAPAPPLVTGRANSVASAVTLLGLVVLGALVHSYNMFGFPLYLGDEGIYMSQAYAVARMNMLTPYPYWYDHAPAGWIFIALWSALTGGFHTFGTAIDGGRTLMLLVHVTSLVLIYRLLLHLTDSVAAAATGGLLFVLSPLSLTFGRMVLLDNIMVMFLLAGTLLLLNYDGQLTRLFAASLFYGLAVLTKESAIFFVPVLIYAVWTLSSTHHTRFARGVWLFGALAAISLYPLYAALRGELIDLSLSSPLNGDDTGVTLVGAVLWQLSRSGGAPWDPQSDFFRALTGVWLRSDPWLLGLGLAAVVWNLVKGDGRGRVVGLLGLVAWLSLVRGAQVLDFYVVVLLPLMALNVGLAAAGVAAAARISALLPVAVVAAAVIGFVNLRGQSQIFTLDLTTTQRQALAWVREHVPSNAQIIIDDDLWVDLRDGPDGAPDFPGAHSHWKAANDPAVYRDLFNDDWRNIDYLVMTPGLERIFAAQQEKLPFQAYSRSTPVARFSVGDAAIEIRRVDNANIAAKDTLATTYASFKTDHIVGGQVRGADGYTDARDQAGAMLMAVWMDDQRTFDELWGWAQLRLQSESGLLLHTSEPGVAPRNFADANADAALALLLAERRWNDASYGRAGARLARALWDSSVVAVEGKPYIAAGDWAVQQDRILFAPSTFAPYAYRLFVEATPDLDWRGVISTGYATLARAGAETLGDASSAGLPPAYVAIERATGDLLPADVQAEGATFNADAAQVYWRVGLDARWNGDARALRFLAASKFLDREWASKGRIGGEYTHSGRVVDSEESLALYSAVLPRFLAVDERAAHAIYGQKISTALVNRPDGARWGKDASIAEQRWAWLATAYYLDTLDSTWSR
jgi:endo-1,4-beta-D-glucanase Y/4-amino-4-deoxy-L-arabinose transferase-like glycosyltransferase